MAAKVTFLDSQASSTKSSRSSIDKSLKSSMSSKKSTTTDSDMECIDVSAKGFSYKTPSTGLTWNSKILPGKNLEWQKVITIDEIDLKESSAVHATTLNKLNKIISKPYREDICQSDFQHLKHLTDGSNSRIFKGNFEGKDVIIKVIGESSCINEIVRQEFEKEIIILSQINQSNIINIYGSGFTESKEHQNVLRRLIVLEALEGDTLSYHLSKKRSFHSRPFREIRWLRMAREFACALDYLHYKFISNTSIIHRDLKPDNIGFTKDGTLKLLDFGLCMTVERSESTDEVFELTGCTGSLRYMAPEVALKQPYGVKVDVYGFGLILHQIITGDTPFAGFDKTKFYCKVVQENERPGLDYDSYGRDVKAQKEILELMGRCWDADVSLRPTSTELYELLHRVENSVKASEINNTAISRSFKRVFSKKDSI